MTEAYDMRESYRGRLFVTGLTFGLWGLSKTDHMPDSSCSGAKTNLSLALNVPVLAWIDMKTEIRGCLFW